MTRYLIQDYNETIKSFNTKEEAEAFLEDAWAYDSFGESDGYEIVEVNK